MQCSGSKDGVALQRFATENMTLKQKKKTLLLTLHRHNKAGKARLDELALWERRSIDLICNKVSMSQDESSRNGPGFLLGSCLVLTLGFVTPQKAALTEHAKSTLSLRSQQGLVSWDGTTCLKVNHQLTQTMRCDICPEVVRKRLHRVQTHSSHFIPLHPTSSLPGPTRPRRPGLVLRANDNAPGTRCTRYAPASQRNSTETVLGIWRKLMQYCKLS